MSELQLSNLLNEIAEQVDPVDLVSRVQRRSQRRYRLQAGGAVVGVLGIIAGATVGAVHLADSGARPARGTTLVPAASSPSHPSRATIIRNCYGQHPPGPSKDSSHSPLSGAAGVAVTPRCAKLLRSGPPAAGGRR